MPELQDLISYEEILRMVGTVKRDRSIAALEDLLLDRVNGEPDEG